MQRSAARVSGKFSHIVGAPGGDALQKAVAHLVLNGKGDDLVQTQLEPNPPLADIVF